MAKKPRRGRRPGQSATKDAILGTARDCFGERGYDATTVRSIALSAGVDQALIHYFFGTKRALFDAALAVGSDGEVEFAPALASETGASGERIVVAFLRRWDVEGASNLGTLLRAAGSDAGARQLLNDLIVRSLTAPAAAALSPGSDLPRLRAALVAAQLVGLAWMRYVERREPLVSASPRLLSKTYGPSISATLMGRRA